ncbi:MAG: hypothetical protein ACKV2V_10055 [Blastocatellia bacterium]
MIRTEQKTMTGMAAEKVVGEMTSENTGFLSQAEEQKENIDFVIEQGMTDLWLLLSGEGLRGSAGRPRKRDGHAFAMVWDGQMHLLGSRHHALDALRSVGLDLSLFDPKYEG